MATLEIGFNNSDCLYPLVSYMQVSAFSALKNNLSVFLTYFDMFNSLY